MAVWIARLEKRKKKKQECLLFTSCFLPVLDSGVGTSIFFSWASFHSTSPVQPSAHQCESISFICSPRRGGCHCLLLRDWAMQRRGCKQPGAQAESPQSPLMGVHGTVPLSVCLKHPTSYSYQCLSKLRAPGTSVNQIFRSSAGIQRKRKHIYGPPAVRRHGGPGRFAQTSSSWRMVRVPSKPKAQTPSVWLIAHLTCTTSSPCFYRKYLERRGNSWWIIHCVPSHLYCSLSSTGRVICTTTSHSPNASGNKGSLSAAVYPKDMERAAGGNGETAAVWDPTQCNP